MLYHNNPQGSGERIQGHHGPLVSTTYFTFLALLAKGQCRQLSWCCVCCVCMLGLSLNPFDLARLHMHVPWVNYYQIPSRNFDPLKNTGFLNRLIFLIIRHIMNFLYPCKTNVFGGRLESAG